MPGKEPIQKSPSKVVRFDLDGLDTIMTLTDKHEDEVMPTPNTTTSTRFLRPRNKSALPEESSKPHKTPIPQTNRNRRLNVTQPLSNQKNESLPITPKLKPASTRPKPKSKSKIKSKNASGSIANTDTENAKRILASQDQAVVREARRTALRKLQAEQNREKTAAEPDLNDAEEVRWFEVDERGSLTLIVLELGVVDKGNGREKIESRDVEIWVMEEVGWDDEGEGTQVVCGRRYRVRTV